MTTLSASVGTLSFVSALGVAIAAHLYRDFPGKRALGAESVKKVFQLVMVFSLVSAALTAVAAYVSTLTPWNRRVLLAFPVLAMNFVMFVGVGFALFCRQSKACVVAFWWQPWLVAALAAVAFTGNVTLLVTL